MLHVHMSLRHCYMLASVSEDIKLLYVGFTERDYEIAVCWLHWARLWNCCMLASVSEANKIAVCWLQWVRLYKCCLFASVSEAIKLLYVGFSERGYEIAVCWLQWGLNNRSGIFSFSSKSDTSFDRSWADRKNTVIPDMMPVMIRCTSHLFIAC